MREQNTYPEGKSGSGNKKLTGPATGSAKSNPKADGAVVESTKKKLR